MRTGRVRDFLLGVPSALLQWGTWFSLAAEVLFLRLAFWSRTRPLAWLALIGLHLGIMSVVSFAELSIGMLLVHWFTYDSRWPAKFHAWRSSTT